MTDQTRHHSRYYTRLIAALGFATAAAPMRAVVPEPAEDTRPHAGGRPGPARDASLAEARARSAGAREGRTRSAKAAQCSAREGGLLVVAPGAAFGRAKQYPPALVAEVVARVVAARAPRVVLVGARGDREGAAAVESALTARTPRAADWLVNLAGRTTLAELMGIIALARVVVSNDSGAMHVASALGTPVVVPFGPTDEHATAPLGLHTLMTADAFCRPCHLRECPIDHRCMRRIDPAAMAAHVIEWIDRRGER